MMFFLHVRALTFLLRFRVSFSSACPVSESRRLAELHGTQLLDTPSDPAFDDLVALAASICGAPMALLSLVDERRQWFKSRIGFPVSETAREHSFCTHAITRDAPLVVEDATADERFAHYPIVVGPPHVRFYAGAPLILSNGAVLGTICVMDSVPRRLGDEQIRALQVLARQVVGEIERRSREQALRESEARHRQLCRLRDYETRVLTAISSAQSLPAILETAASGIEEVLGYGFASVMVVDADGARLRYGAAPHLPAAIRQALIDEGVPIGPVASSCGMAAHRGEAVIVNDIATDPLWAADREFALGNGLRACWSTPVLDVSGKVLATFAVFLSEAGACGPQDQEYLNLAAHLVRLALEREERRAQAERLTQKLSEQAALLDKARDAIVVRSLDHRVLFWNRGAERLYGWSAEEALGRDVSRLIYRDPSRFLTASENTLARGEWTGEIEQIRRDGTDMVVEGRWTLVRDARGAPVSILAINTDISERKLLERQFLRAQRLESIGTLAGGIAHDLNNILVPITLGVDLLRNASLSPEERTLLSSIGGSARRAREMVKQVFTFARGVEGARVPVRVEEVVGEVRGIIERTFPKNLHIATEPLPAGLLILGDATQLNQVLINLCVNARDAMPRGGALKIRAGRRELNETEALRREAPAPGAYVLIEVEDTGCGMPAPVRDRIFEPFFTTKDMGHGTGLGLSTALGIVRSHGGFIHVESESGRGSRFQVYLPEAAPEICVDESETGADVDALPRGSGEWILVVDDEATILEVTCHMLEAFGYRVVAARDGGEALAIFTARQREIALVLTDMLMPVMDGAALIAAVRRLRPGFPVIASSGFDPRAGQGAGSSADADGFIPKPYTMETIIGEVAAVLGRKRARAA